MSATKQRAAQVPHGHPAHTCAFAVHVSTKGVRAPIARERVVQLACNVLEAEHARAAELSITFVDDKTIASLNRKHLHHSGATDVITFALPSIPATLVTGDIYISPTVAKANAIRHGCSVREEVARLVVHGVLHALGYEHPEDDARTTSAMWKRQERLLARFWP